MSECLFCKIVAGEIPAKKVFESSDVMAFWDIHQKAPVHILIIPKIHISGVNETADKDSDILGKLIIAAKEVGKKEGVDKSGYRLIINQGPHSGQEVDHLHVHLLGGKPLGGMITIDS